MQSKDSCVPIGEKIDLNNANVIAFRDCPGYYPTLAKKIISNGPYGSVEEVLNIRGLNLKQKKLLEDKLDLFTITESNTDFATRMPPRPMMRWCLVLTIEAKEFKRWKYRNINSDLLCTHKPKIGSI